MPTTVPVTAQRGHFVTADAPDDHGFKKGTAPMVYWRKPDVDPNTGDPMPEANWIYITQEDDLHAVARLEAGWARLPKYGSFFPGKNGFNPVSDPYRPLLDNGGIHEFPVDQVIALGWHRKPPRGYSPDDFPQLKDVVLTDVQCKIHGCFHWFKNQEDYDKHYSVAHAKVAQNKDLATALAQSGLAANAPLVEFLKGLAENQAGLQTMMVEQTKVLTELTKQLASLREK